MKDYVKIIQHETSISVCFYIEHDEIITIGEKMNEINENAYMNGYNWEAFLKYYLMKNNPDVLENMGSDPEAGMYVAYFKLNDENKKKAEKLAGIIENLVENKSSLYEIVRNYGDEIEWD